ncbi:MAG TPA: phospholipid scramblase-related protein [Actinomycetota bacterium]|nr:phospholipid scramblase-related protein [Actinomycetota bacterium]
MTDLLSHDVLVISQKAKLIEMTNEYRVFDDGGTEIGTIREVEQSRTTKAVRLFSGVDQFLTHKLGVFDHEGRRVLMLERPSKLLKSRIKVSDAGGAERGAILQDNVVGPKHFTLVDAGGARIGSIDGENWMSWDFAIHDATGAEVGRITKQWAGILKEGYTTADTYVLQIESNVTADLRLLMFASAVGLDVALKQDDTGGWGFGGVG